MAPRCLAACHHESSQMYWIYYDVSYGNVFVLMCNVCVSQQTFYLSFKFIPDWIFWFFVLCCYTSICLISPHQSSWLTRNNTAGVENICILMNSIVPYTVSYTLQVKSQIKKYIFQIYNYNYCQIKTSNYRVLPPPPPLSTLQTCHLTTTVLKSPHKPYFYIKLSIKCRACGADRVSIAPK